MFSFRGLFVFVGVFPPMQAAEIAAMAQDEKKAEGNVGVWLRIPPARVGREHSIDPKLP